MRDMKDFIKILVSILFIMMIQPSFAALQCDACTENCYGHNILFTISGGAVHTQHIGSFGTNIKNIRCWDDNNRVTITSNGTASYNTILFRTAGGHAQTNAYTTYPNTFYISSNEAPIECNYRNSCNTDEACVASMSAQNNAHIGTCDEFTNKVCCNIASCVLESVVISSQCTGPCAEGDAIKADVKYYGACPATAYIQVDALSDDDECLIAGKDAAINNGIRGTCVSSPCTFTWAIPEIPLQCQGKHFNAIAGGVYTNNYEPENFLDNIPASGSFDLFINSGLITVTPSIEFSKSRPNLKENFYAYITANVSDGNAVIACNQKTSYIDSIKIDDQPYSGTIEWQGSKWQTQIDTSIYHSIVDAVVIYKAAGKSGSAQNSYSVNFPPEISNWQTRGNLIGSGQSLVFSADVIDDGEVDKVKACNDITYNGCKGLYCNMERDNGNTYTCSFDTSNLQVGESYGFYIFANDTEGAWNSTKEGYYGSYADSSGEDEPIIPTPQCGLGQTKCSDGVCRASCQDIVCDEDGVCAPTESCLCKDCYQKQDSCTAGLVCSSSTKTCQEDTDSDGVPDDEDECPETPIGTLVDSYGCPIDIIVCSAGQTKCADGICRTSCQDSICNEDGICQPESGESCECADCYEKRDSCGPNLICSSYTKQCCNPYTQSCNPYQSPLFVTDMMINPKLEFTGISENLIAVNGEGNPVLTKSDTLDVVVTGIIESFLTGDAVRSRLPVTGFAANVINCNPLICNAQYTIDANNDFFNMEWDTFTRGWIINEGTLNLECNKNHAITIILSSKLDASILPGTKKYTFFLSCEPKIIISPIEKRAVINDRDFTVFNVTMKNPLESETIGELREYNLVMSAGNVGQDYIISWLNMTDINGNSIGTSVADGISADLLISNYNSTTIRVKMDTAGRSGIFPIKFTAITFVDGESKQYTSTGTIMIFAEGLDEFAPWQAAVAMIFGGFIFFILVKKKII